MTSDRAHLIVQWLRDRAQEAGAHGFVIGLSGGIDSATVTALLVHVLGPANVTAVSMPSRFNGPTTLGITGQIASNLGVELVTVPIQEMVDQRVMARRAKRA
mgnify:CR=1 FL=1